MGSDSYRVRQRVELLVAENVFETFLITDTFAPVPGLAATVSVLCLHAGTSAILLGRMVLFAVLLNIAAALLQRVSGEYRLSAGGRTSRSRRMGMPLATVLVLVLISLMRYPQGRGAQDTASGSEQQTGRVLDGDYKGVILLPEVSEHTVLVPPLPFLRQDLFSANRRDPLSIPFSGVYWMFRWPHSKPPPESYVVRGSPLTSVFRSSDRFSLSMEAHQSFGTLIDLSCCRQIQLAVRTADGPTTLELILTNTMLTDRRPMSLGAYRIPSALGRRDAAPVPVVVSFDVPGHPSLSEFDEATIVFNPTYAAASAQVTIDRFIFVPRGYGHSCWPSGEGSVSIRLVRRFDGGNL